MHGERGARARAPAQVIFFWNLMARKLARCFDSNQDLRPPLQLQAHLTAAEEHKIALSSTQEAQVCCVLFYFIILYYIILYYIILYYIILYYIILHRNLARPDRRWSARSGTLAGYAMRS
jgi:hypothetical protein